MEGGICTPMIAHWPEGIKLPGKSIYREPCHLIDFVPTFIELAGDKASYPKNLPKFDGVSLCPTFSGKKLKRSEPLFFQYGSWQVIRHNQWKLVQQKTDPWKLYDLSKDRTETKNLAGLFNERTAQMKNEWEKWAKNTGVKVSTKKRINSGRIQQ